MPLKILFFGTSSFGLPTLEALIKSPHELKGVVTVPDQKQGRGLSLSPSPVKEWALKNRVPIFQFKNPNHPKALAEIAKVSSDLFVVVAYGFILSEKLLSIPSKGTYNLHASLLPRYRGAAPIAWALLNGETKTGVTIFKVVPQLDAGPMLIQREIPIQESDDAVSLSLRLSKLGGELFLEAIEQIAMNRVSLKEQPSSLVTLAPKLRKKMGHIDWAQSSERVFNQVRALKPWPKSFTVYKEKRVIIAEVRRSESPMARKAKPGEILSVDAQSGIMVQTGDGVLCVLRLQPEGGNEMDTSAFLFGHQLKSGEVFS